MIQSLLIKEIFAKITWHLGPNFLEPISELETSFHQENIAKEKFPVTQFARFYKNFPVNRYWGFYSKTFPLWCHFIFSYFGSPRDECILEKLYDTEAIGNFSMMLAAVCQSLRLDSNFNFYNSYSFLFTQSSKAQIEGVPWLKRTLCSCFFFNKTRVKKHGHIL